jgi:hypothetical protein
MVYLNLDIDRKGLFDLVGQALGFNRERGQVDSIFKQERAQALLSAAASAGGWSAVDVKIGLAQITPRTLEYISTPGGKVQSIEYVDLYHALYASPTVLFGNGLKLYTFGPSSSFNGKANFDPADDKRTIHLLAKEVATRTLDLRLVWEVVSPPPQQAKVFVHLINEQNGQTVAQRDLLPLDGKADTRNWRKGDYYQDVHSLPLPSGLSAGRYRIEVGLYDAVSLRPIVTADYAPSVIIGYVEIA